MDTFYVIKDSTLKGFADVTRSLTGEEKTYTTSEMISTLSESTGLNFSIVSYPTEEALLEATPKENTIGVVTDVEIPEWYFASKNPYIHTSEDLYASEGSKSGYYLNASGNEVASTSYKITEKIDLPDRTFSIMVSASSTFSGASCYAFYDADDRLISTVLRETGNFSYDVPVGTKSVRLSVRSDDPGSLIATYTDVDTEEGALCVLLGDFGDVNLNILKKNSIQAYPLNAKQYISGSWVSVETKIFQNSEWKQIISDFIMYDRGTKNVEFVTTGQGSLTENSNHLLLKTTNASYATFDVNVENVDVTQYKTLTMTFLDYTTTTGNGSKGMFLYDGDTRIVSGTGASGTSGTLTADISKISGVYTIKIRLYSESLVRQMKVTNLALLVT